MAESVQRSMARGALWMVLFKAVERSLGLISTLFLVRLLMPADFGVVAMAMSFVVMAEILTAFSFDVALIQRQHAERDLYDSAWTGNVLLGSAVTLVMLALAEPIARFYARPELFWVVAALSFGPLVVGFENIGTVAFRKELDFRKEFLFQLSRKVGAILVTVPLAFAFRSYWALVAGILFSKAFGVAISYVAHPFRPRFSGARLRELIGLSRWLLGNNLVNFFKDRGPDFLIGRLHGATGLGLYNVSQEIANLPVTELGAAINRALLPGFAKMADAHEIRTAYAAAMSMLALIALPAAAGIYAIAPVLVPVALGGKWLDGIPLIEAIALSAALTLFHNSIASVLLARGFQNRVVATNVLYVATVLVVGVLLAASFGLVGFAWATIVAGLVTTPMYLFQAKRTLGVEVGTFARAIVRPLLAAITMATVVRLALPADLSAIAAPRMVVVLLESIALGAVTYGATVALAWVIAGRPHGAERMLIARLAAVLAGRFGPRSGRAS